MRLNRDQRARQNSNTVAHQDRKAGHILALVIKMLSRSEKLGALAEKHGSESGGTLAGKQVAEGFLLHTEDESYFERVWLRLPRLKAVAVSSSTKSPLSRIFLAPVPNFSSE
jgi:hypothetical protein